MAGRNSEEGKRERGKKRELFRPERFQTLSAVFGQCAAALVRHSVLTRPLTILKCHYGAIQQRVENLVSAEKRPSRTRAPALSETGQVTGTRFGQNRHCETTEAIHLLLSHLLNSSEQKPRMRRDRTGQLLRCTHMHKNSSTSKNPQSFSPSRAPDKNSRLIYGCG